MSKQPSEPITPEFREEVVAKFCRDMAARRIRFRWNTDVKWEDDIEEGLRKSVQLNTKGVVVYTDPKSSPEERAAVVDSIFISLLNLQMNGLIEEVLSQTQLEKDIASIEARFEAMRNLTMQLLTVMQDVNPKLDEVIRKVDRL